MIYSQPVFLFLFSFLQLLLLVILSGCLGELPHKIINAGHSGAPSWLFTVYEMRGWQWNFYSVFLLLCICSICAILFWKKKDELLRTSLISALGGGASPHLAEGDLTAPSAPSPCFLCCPIAPVTETSKVTHLSASGVALIGPGLSFPSLTCKYYLFCLLRHARTQSGFPSNSVVASPCWLLG